MTVTLLTQDGIAGGPELTSHPFTPNAGDCVLVVWSLQAGGTPHDITITKDAPNYRRS